MRIPLRATLASAPTLAEPFATVPTSWDSCRFRTTDRLRSRLGKSVLPNRDRKCKKL